MAGMSTDRSTNRGAGTRVSRSTAGLLALSAALVLGCNSRPVAPALRDDPVYQNDREGFRFLVPEGWSQQAKSEVPPGKLKKEHLLVQYKRLGGDKGAMLEVTMADLPSSADLSAQLAGPSYGAKSWQPSGKAETLEVDGVPATRLKFTTRMGKEDMTKEVVAFRRGERVYFFVGLFTPADGKAREQVRRAVLSTTWKK
jgi:hypothetical protein